MQSSYVFFINRFLLAIICCLVLTSCKKGKIEARDEGLYKTRPWHFTSFGYDPAPTLPDRTLAVGYISTFSVYWPGTEGIKADTLIPDDHYSNDSVIAMSAGEGYDYTILYYNTNSKKLSIANRKVVDHGNGSGIPDEYYYIDGYAE